MPQKPIEDSLNLVAAVLLELLRDDQPLSLVDIERARQSEAFAKLRARYADEL